MGKTRVGVIFGGVSSEHDISLLSAYNIITNIPTETYEVVSIGITKKGRWFCYPGDPALIPDGSWEQSADCVPAVLSPDPLYHGLLLLEGGQWVMRKLDVIFPALHGRCGEDGAIQGLMELSGVPYVGCGVMASANCMDKDMTHRMLEAAGIKTAKWRAILSKNLSRLESFMLECERELKYPMFVKPANGGSTIGVTKAKNREQLEAAIKLAFSHDKKVVVEEMIQGIELECAVMGTNPILATVPGEICPEVEYYDFQAKYVDTTTQQYIPARISEEAQRHLSETAKKAFLTLECAGLARVDFFYQPQEDTLILNEINTLPGFTNISMYSKLMAYTGISGPELMDKLISLAMEKE